jgi:hypothetical protein
VPEIKICQAAFAGIVLAFALAGCSGDLSSFSVADLNPLKGEDPLRQADYNYFYNRGQVTTGPVTAADLVGPDGRCAFAPAAAPSRPEPVATAPAPAAAPAEQPINPRSNQALYFTAGPEANRGVTAAQPGGLPPEVRNGPTGISLAMTECQMIAVAGNTDRVEIGADERGERVVTLTYLSGYRPGIYRFRGGRLVSMERVAEPPQQKTQRAAKTKQAR